jgi:hypothetical protein
MLSQVVWPLFAAPSVPSYFAVFRQLGYFAYLGLFALFGYLVVLYADFADDTTVRFSAVVVFVLWLIATTSDNIDGWDFVLFVPLIAIGIGLLVGQSVDPDSPFAQLVPPPGFVLIVVGAAVIMTIPPFGEFYSRMPGELAERYFSVTPPESCYRGTNYSDSFEATVPATDDRCWSPSVSELAQWLVRR